MLALWLLWIFNLSPAERSRNARIAAYSKWAKSDPVEGTQKARDAFLRRFLDEVDPEGVLPVAERQRRAEAAKRAHFTRMAARSARARRRGAA